MAILKAARPHSRYVVTMRRIEPGGPAKSYG